MPDWDRPLFPPASTASHGPGICTPEEEQALAVTSSPAFVQRYGAPLLQRDGLAPSEHTLQNTLDNCYQVALEGELFDLQPQNMHIEFADGASLAKDVWTMRFRINLHNEQHAPLEMTISVPGTAVADNIRRGGGSDVDDIGVKGALLAAVVEALHARYHVASRGGTSAVSPGQMDQGYRTMSNLGKDDNSVHTLSDMLYERTGRRGSFIAWGQSTDFRLNNRLPPAPTARELARTIEVARERGLPVVFGTEMSSGRVQPHHAYAVKQVGDTHGTPWVALRNPLGHNRNASEAWVHDAMESIFGIFGKRASAVPGEAAVIRKSLASLFGRESHFFIGGVPDDPALAQVPSWDACWETPSQTEGPLACEARKTQAFEYQRGAALVREFSTLPPNGQLPSGEPLHCGLKMANIPLTVKINHP